MLILGRRIGEVICIGNDVSVRILEIHGNQVRIGIEAPKELAVHREEVFRRMGLEQAGAQKDRAGRCQSKKRIGAEPE